MTIVNASTPEVKAIDRDHAEMLLHTDSMIGEWQCGDVEVWPAEMWPDFTDDWRWEPTDMDVLIEEEDFVKALMAERAEHEATIADCEFENEMDRAEFEAWLDSLSPSYGELENRDLSDCGLGHPA